MDAILTFILSVAASIVAYYRNFQKYCLSKQHICDMQFADVACALKTQTAIYLQVA